MRNMAVRYALPFTRRFASQVRDERRHVIPYDHTFTSFAKRRWVGRRVLEVMAAEFPAQCTEYYLSEAVSAGRLTLNGHVVEPNAVFRQARISRGLRRGCLEIKEKVAICGSQGASEGVSIHALSP